MSAGSPISGHIRTSSSGISRASCGFQRASESTEERNSNAIAITLCAREIAGRSFRLSDSTMPRHCHIAARFLVHTAAPLPRRGRSMRSLWRVLALQWLGGDGSEALTGDSTVLDLCSASLSGQCCGFRRPA